MDHVFKINEEYKIGSLSITGTTEWVLAGSPEYIYGHLLGRLELWEKEEGGFFYRGNCNEEMISLPNFIFKFIVISSEYKVIEVSHFSNSSFSECQSEISSILETKEFKQAFLERSFYYP